jgi:predicted nuclease of restriction endonuclease-like (RecB) superfamily
VQQTASGLFQRTGKAVTNFETTLPKAQSDLARETLKNPFIFEILGLTEEMQERELERAFTQDIKKFMLELGRGFAYVGNQYNLVVEKDDYFLDLLFYNFHLHCFVVVELKIGDFKPEYTGKLNFYINTIDEQIKGAIDAPTIGVLLCKTQNETVVKYALKGIATPMGVAQYEFTKALPKQLKGEMPSVKELQHQLDATSALLQKPIDEKKNKLKNILDKMKGDEVKKEKDLNSLLYIFDKVIWGIKEYTEQLLKDEMSMFRKATITRTINDSPFLTTSVDLEANLIKNGVYRIGLQINLETLKKGGTKAFNIYKDLSFQLSKHKYTLYEKAEKNRGEYLYHHEWSAEEMKEVAEWWSELIIDDISVVAEKIKS